MHLAGVGIGDSRWSDAHKAAVLSSRVKGTTLLARTLGGLSQPPTVLASSALGRVLRRPRRRGAHRGVRPGKGFLTAVCEQWEAATAPAADAGIRVAHLRTGIVLSADGGALKQMCCLSSSVSAAASAAASSGGAGSRSTTRSAPSCHVVDNDRIQGAVNLTAPEPSTNEEFTRTLKRVLHRPTLLPTPTFALKAMFSGEAVEEMFLAGQRVQPARLEAAGYDFRHPQLEGALRDLLGRPA